MNKRNGGIALKSACAALAVVMPLIGAIFGSKRALAQVSSSEPTGVVRSPDGSPLGLVWVQVLGAWSGKLTGADGRFGLPSRKLVTLLFIRDGFAPQIREIPESEESFSVVLEPQKKIGRRLLACRQKGGDLHQLEPANVAGLKLGRGGDVDFGTYYATYSRDGQSGELSSMTGIHVNGFTPTPEWSAGLSSFTIRSLICGDDQWFDLRGLTATGLESRWVGYAFSHVEYSKVPAVVARALDRAIDSGCCR